ncbi:MAG: M14 family metallopeptidase [Chloroflexi bacterium]|nr:M14 family metallopeptidase [Chloroflexota bacterium]
MSYHIDFGEYFLFDDLTTHVKGLAAAYPKLAALESLGKSWRDRDIWCMTLTNSATGAHDTKPAFYIDAHIHAEEVTTSHTALYTIWYLLRNYSSNAEVTWLLDNTTFYIIPRLNPDGAEISLTTGHHWCGNGRYLPGEEQTRGLCQQDINGDGLIVQMRIKDEAGEWKISKDDPRLMIQRQPGETGDGPYYRLYREGVIKGEWDGVSFDIERPRDGNLNRNFPAGWWPEKRQYGAGDLPLSEPEALACANFILSHPNIAGMQCYHTHGGLHLRPSLIAPDSTLPRGDLALIKRIGAMGTAITGYPTISVYEEFTTDPDNPRTGSLMQWSYDELGIITFSTELWNPELAAELQEPAKYQIRARSTEDEMKLLKYNDEHLGGKGFVNWQPFDHPQLGPIEIGGWTHMYTFRNPPSVSMATSEKAKNFLRDTIHTNCLFTLKHAACTPLVQIESVTAEALGADLHKVTAVVTNVGFLPTNMTARALKHGTAGSVKTELQAADGVELIMGKPEQDLGHLAGRDERVATWSPWMPDWHHPKAKAEWLVRGAAGSEITITAGAQRAGSKQAAVKLG